MMATSETQREDLVGQRVKERRAAAGLSMRQLAEKAGLTASFISQVERGQANPSISTLRRIADALAISILSFFVDPPNESPIIHEETRPRFTFPDHGLSYQFLTPKSARRIAAFIGRVEPGVGNFARPLREPTEECVLVLSGSIRVELETGGYVLRAGDSICFEGVLLKGMSNASDEEAVWISMLTPPVF
jgi:transcriptional regulator with XRE-family HTH domain